MESRKPDIDAAIWTFIGTVLCIEVEKARESWTRLGLI